MLANKLKGKGAVLIQGSKWCGKTIAGGYNSEAIQKIVNRSV